MSSNMMSEMDIDSLTIKQYLMLTKGNQAPSMGKPEFRRTIKKNIEEMTIAEYMDKNVNSSNHKESWNLGNKYHFDCSKINAYYDLPSSLLCFEPIQPHTPDRYEPLEEDTDFVSEDESEIGEQEVGNDIDNDKPLAPRPRHVNEELGPEEDLDEWLKTEMEKRMCRQEKESEEDALIDILKSLVEECKVVYKEASSCGTNEVQGVYFVADNKEGDTSGTLPSQLPPKELNLGSFTLPCIIGNLNLYDMENLGASVNVMPKLIFEHLKLASLKQTSMVVEMADMTKKAPLGIVENILVKLDKFLFPSDFVIIDMLGEQNETIILGRPFLATIHAQINVFKREISLGIGEKFDMDGGISHYRIPVEKIYMANFFHEGEYFNPLEIENDVFSYESPSCLLFEQCTQSYDNKSVDALESAGSIQGLEDNHEDVDCGMWPTCNPDLSFCSGYDAIYGKEENGMLEQWMSFWDHERQSVRGNQMIFVDFLKVRYGNKIIDDTTRERRYYECCTE
ncbi:phospholipase-like protein [Tanacetum coccineum]